MPTTVFLLGAGASKQGGAPLMAEFVAAARNLRRTSLPQEFHADFDLVFKAMVGLQAVHSKATLDFNNIESLFSAFEVGKTLGKLPGSTEGDIDDVISALKVLIVVTLERSILFPYSKEGGLRAPEPYPEFAQLIKTLRHKVAPTHDVALLTFNYDVCLDFALNRGGMQVHYGLDGTAGDGANVPLLKLHGSLNWTEDSETREIVPWTIREYFKNHDVGLFEVKNVVLPIGTQLPTFKCGQTKLSGLPVLVAPTFNKGDSHRTLSQVWKSAAEVLGRAENIFVIGYSFPETDNFFEYLYALGTVGTTLLERIWLFNPDTSGRVGERFDKLIGAGAKQSYRAFQQTFEQAIVTIGKEFPSSSQVFD